MTDEGRQRRFDDPIPLSDGRVLHTLRDAADYISGLPKEQSDMADWQIAAEALMVASRTGPTALAQIAFMKALNGDTPNVTSNAAPFFAVRLLNDGAGYVVDAVWVNGTTEQIGGMPFKDPASAARWVRESSATWVKERLTNTANIIQFRGRPT